MGKLALFYLVPLVLTIFCLVDAISSREGDVRHLPKLWWILLILFFPVVGSIAWLVAGRPAAAAPRRRERTAPQFPEYDRPGRMAATADSPMRCLLPCGWSPFWEAPCADVRSASTRPGCRRALP